MDKQTGRRIPLHLLEEQSCVKSQEFHSIIIITFFVPYLYSVSLALSRSKLVHNLIVSLVFPFATNDRYYPGIKVSINFDKLELKTWIQFVNLSRIKLRIVKVTKMKYTQEATNSITLWLIGQTVARERLQTTLYMCQWNG